MALTLEREASRTSSPIRLLLIEDNEADAYFLGHVLKKKDASFDIRNVERLEKGIQLIRENEPDVILLDLSLPDSFGLETFQKVFAAAPRIPIVLMTGLNDESLALEALRLGAQDYLIKGSLDGAMLSRVIRYAIERKRTEESLRKYAAELSDFNQKLETSARDLQRANHRLREMDEMKTSFLAIASHELKSPLTVMKGFIDILMQADGYDEAQKESLQFLKQGAERMRRLVDELLNISRIELGQISMKMSEKIDLKKILKDITRSYGPQMEKKNISFKEEIEESLMGIYADEDRLREVLDNLLSNALKYTDRGGEIWVRAKNLTRGVEISVKDTGIGIEEKDLKIIFEPFQHLRQSGLEGEESTGLGLALVKKIVDAHGGKINVRSKAGDGSVFSVYLPERRLAEAP